MSLNLFFRKYFAIALNILHLAPRFWQDSSKYFVAVDYHYLAQKAIAYPTLEINREVLEKQLHFIKENMNLINPKTYNDNFFKKNTSKKPSILITIDDADCSIKENFDLFQKYQIPIILFAPFGLCLDKNSRDGLMSRVFRSFNEINENKKISLENKNNFFQKVANSSADELRNILSELSHKRDNIDPISTRTLLTLEELKVMSLDPLVTIGSHSMSHPVLSSLPKEWLSWEIKTSIDYLNSVNGDKRYFAYPYGFKGATNFSVKNHLKNTGVRYAFSTRSMVVDKDSDNFELGRIGMLNFFNKRYLNGLLGGAFEIFDKVLFR